MPTCQWHGGVLYAGTQIIQDLSHLSFDAAYRSIYEQMSFFELTELMLELFDRGVNFRPDDLFATYGFRLDSKTEKVVLSLRRLPSEFYQWAKQHSLSSGDLYSLCNLPQLPVQSLTQLALLNPSRSFGIQLLDLLVDCLLMGQSEDTCLLHSSSFDLWRDHLRTLRFPQTTKRDEEKKQSLLNIWPKSFTVRWLRQGDRSGVDVRFFVSSKKELEEKIESLQRVYNDFAD